MVVMEDNKIIGVVLKENGELNMYLLFKLVLMKKDLL